MPWLLGLVVVLAVSGPPNVFGVYGGLDRSWQVALSLTRPQGLRFGHDLLFTYGPYGFLDYPLPIDPLGMSLGLLYAIAIATATYLLAQS
ncbi:MAG: hypothetical protein ABIO16_03070, partial [Nocardioides sp.]